MTHQRHGLQRLAQSHVVGQDPSEPSFVERSQPCEACALIGPQGGDKSGGWGRRDGVRSLHERTHRLLPRARLPVHDAQRLEFLPQPGLEAAETDGLGRGVLECASFCDQRGQLP